ncbi:MAG TPA: hypothetical protein HA257_02250 [Candidatus Methanoperedenaceae archaeon]|nr:hypothetical protein [Candidatus Methanoperedenaceae archaeon]
MELFELHAVLGLAFVLFGMLFDFGFVTTSDNFRDAQDHRSEKVLWRQYAHGLARFYLIVLGLLDIAFALLISHTQVNEGVRWAVFWLLNAGSVLFIAGGLWEAQAGPVYKWEPPCYVLGAGLAAVIGSILLEMYLLVT